MENDTCLEKYHFSELKNITKLPSDDIATYCILFDEFTKYWLSIGGGIIGYSMAISGGIGLISYVLTYITFSDTSAFPGPSFIYHKAMALIELIHMAVMCQYGVLRVLGFPGGYSMAVWDICMWGGWMFGDTAKLCINCLTTFVSVERVVAVWLPLHFDVVNQDRVVAGAILISMVISSLQLTSLGAFWVTDENGYYTGVYTEFGRSAMYEGIQRAIYFIKLGLGAFTFLLCLIIILGMHRSKKRVSKMTSGAQNRWQAVKMACYLQMIVAVSGLIDHIAWVSFKIIDHPYPNIGRNAMVLLDSLDKAKSELDRMRVRQVSEVIQVLAGEINHGGRFYFYVIFHKTFRETFVGLRKRLTRTKVTTLNGGASKS